MSARRHYPPIVTFHAPRCWMFGGNAPALPIDVARDQFPNHHFDVCAAADITPYVTVEECRPAFKQIRGTNSDRASDVRPNATCR